MKNVLILSSSPRRGGNSDTLCDEFMQGAIESGHRVEKVFLRDKTIHPCTGCGVCSQYKKPCPQKDDAAEIIGKMLAADVIVMATPVYFYTMSAQMKTLIDRCCGPYTSDLLLWGANTVVLFYETFSSSYSYTRLGKIENPAGLVDVLGRGNVRVARFSLSK